MENPCHEIWAGGRGVDLLSLILRFILYKDIEIVFKSMQLPGTQSH